MNDGKRRTAGIRWDRWHRLVTMQSLEMMVMNRVLRRAEIDPPRRRNDATDSRVGPDRPVSFLTPVNADEQGWFTRFFRRRAESSFTHMRPRT